MSAYLRSSPYTLITLIDGQHDIGDDVTLVAWTRFSVTLPSMPVGDATGSPTFSSVIGDICLMKHTTWAGAGTIVSTAGVFLFHSTVSGSVTVTSTRSAMWQSTTQ